MNTELLPRTEPEPAIDPNETYVLHFKADGPGVPVRHRVKRLLKAALRAYGLRCTKVTGPDAEPPASPRADASRVAPINMPLDAQGLH